MIKKFDSISELNGYINPLIQGDFSGDDMLVLSDHVKKLKAGDFYLEIGVKRGKSAATAIFSAEEGVNMFFCDIQDWGADSTTISRKDFFESQGFDTKSIFLLGDSAKIALVWPKIIEFSLIFIDGNHHYEPVKADIEGWMPHLKSGGTILFHDYMGGVQKAVDELVKNSSNFRDFFVAMEKYAIHSSSIAGATKI